MINLKTTSHFKFSPQKHFLSLLYSFFKITHNHPHPLSLHAILKNAFIQNHYICARTELLFFLTMIDEQSLATLQPFPYSELRFYKTKLHNTHYRSNKTSLDNLSKHQSFPSPLLPPPPNYKTTKTTHPLSSCNKYPFSLARGCLKEAHPFFSPSHPIRFFHRYSINSKSLLKMSTHPLCGLPSRKGYKFNEIPFLAIPSVQQLHSSKQGPPSPTSHPALPEGNVLGWVGQC